MAQAQFNTNPGASQALINGMVSQVPTPDAVQVRLNPSSVAFFAPGTPLKLIAGVSKEILVDACTSNTDGPVFGLLSYELQKALPVAGQVATCVRRGEIMLTASAAVSRGAQVSLSASPTSSLDATFATDSTSGHYVAGVAVTQAAGAGSLFRVAIEPAKIP